WVEPAVVLEQLGDRGRVLLRPPAGVVARSVPAGEGVGEVRRAVAGRDARVEAGSGEDLGLEGEDVLDRVAVLQRVPAQVQHRRGQVLERLEALAEALRVPQRLDDLGIQRLTGLPVAGVAGHHLRVQGPHLELLRGELDVVAGDGRTRV